MQGHKCQSSCASSRRSLDTTLPTNSIRSSVIRTQKKIPVILDLRKPSVQF